MFEFERKLNYYPQKVNSMLKKDYGKTLSTVLLYLNAGICNQDCTYCDKKYYEIDAKTFSKNLLDNLLEDMTLMGVDSMIILGEGGEPIIDKNLVWLIGEATKRSIACGIYTNGSIINDEIIDAFNKLKFVRISLDAGSKDVHSSIHKYPPTRNDFMNAIELMRRLDKSKVSVGAAFIILEENVGELYDAWKLLDDIGIEYFEIKLPLKENYEYSDLSDDLRNMISKQIKKIHEVKNKKTKVVYNKHFELFLSGKEDVTQLTNKECMACLTSSFRTIVSPLGYFLCSPLKNIEEFRYGDPYTESLADAWNGEKRKSLIGRQCQVRCTYYKQNETLNVIAENGYMRIEKDDSEQISQKQFL